MQLYNLLKHKHSTLAQRVLKTVCSSYYKTLIIRHLHVEVFINPTPKEIREASKANSHKSFRFIADNVSKILYVWDGSILHDLMEPHLDLKATRVCEIFYGTGYFVDHKIQIDSNDSPSIYRGTDWSWTNQYGINISSYVNLYT